ncbi:MAG: SDR family NAD(P)-dependent oxidoreductase [bacterium]|nr:SDR family NAD(P)-dependent oxidoreductase [bacterium]
MPLPTGNPPDRSPQAGPDPQPPARYPPRPGAVAVVTGAASGIGAALARRLAADGARVVASDIDIAGAEEVAAGIGGLARFLDVADSAATRELIDEVERSLGPVEIYCSNAGLLVPGGVDTTEDGWQQSWEVHVMAHFHAARVLLPRWVERGGGILVVTASAAGLLTQLDSVSYAVTKHAAVAAAEWLAITYGDGGIQVAALCPQAVRTPLLEGSAAEGTPVESAAAVVHRSAADTDGVLEPDAVADATAEALRQGRFLVLPHPEVSTYAKRRADDPDRWLAGMRRLARRMSD